ncbi:relaxase/mobilization nuclease family protein [Bifidobacterium saguini DSM 23967]|uniref:Relaxase/mobilization nuclease family protein n=2 Tax=Bifidobacterium saguini TaxID=762210 RepID=A0A087D5Q7_9BIFI|nr:hypothetical protein [Bifidobacterium saguini]KFI90857.1 relaxase/mobilization nuclease family protein [Bifidobacterium saguini DSM 23967]QTB90730.1 relaxase [Bifidobacterium saguini]
MIPNIVRGSNPAGLIRYLFGKGRHNEHTDQHLVCSSRDMAESFDDTGKPTVSFEEIGRRFDRRYRVMERKGEPCPPDMRGKRNPGHEHGRHRVWHCSLAIKAGQGILTDQEWENLIRDYLTRLGVIQGEDDRNITWLAVRHGLSRNGNDHVHIAVQLARNDDWINPYHDRIHAQKACRSMEKERGELVELGRSDTGARIRWQYSQWRRWAEWKAENDYGDGWDALDAGERSRLIASVAASTMPRQRVALIVEACARASHSEDEFIRRIRREGFSIDPRLRKGAAKDSFTDPGQVVGYRITWHSSDGWTERFNAFDLGDDMRLKRLRSEWKDDARSRALAVQEWRAAMENRPPFLDDGRERQPGSLSTHDMERLVAESFRVAMSLENSKDDMEYQFALRDGLRTFDKLRERYGLDQDNGAWMMNLPETDTSNGQKHATA